VNRVPSADPLTASSDRDDEDLSARLGRAVAPMLRPVTVAAVAIEDLDAVEAVHGTDAVRALGATWNARLRALAPAPAAVFPTSPGEAIVALPASTPDLRVAIASLGGTGQPTLDLGGTRLRVRAAVGTATLEPGSDSTPAQVLSRARAALARARRGPAPRVHAHAAGDPESVLDGLAVAAMLQQALERGAFRLVFLPKVRVIDRAVIGAEALIRWTLPSTGEAVPARRILADAEAAAIALMANACTLFNPAAVVLGGGMLTGWPALRQVLERRVLQEISAPVRTGMCIVDSLAGSDAILWGAAGATQQLWQR